MRDTLDALAQLGSDRWAETVTVQAILAHMNLEYLSKMYGFYPKMAMGYGV